MESQDNTQNEATKTFFQKFWWAILIPIIVAAIFLWQDSRNDVVPDEHEMNDTTQTPG